MAVLLVPVVPAAATTPDRLRVVTTLRGEPTDYLHKVGAAVAMSADGGTIVVGSPEVNSDRPYPGQAYVFMRAPGGWAAIELTRSGPVTSLSTWGDSVAVSADGSTVAVGDRFDSRVAAGLGSVDTYRRGGDGWVFASEVTDPRTQPYADFGGSLALSGDGSRLIVGDSSYTGPEVHGWGVAWTFAEQPSGAWGRPEELLPPRAAVYYQFGASVAMSADGRTALVGTAYSAKSRIPSSDNSGRVMVYNADATGTWRMSHIFTDPLSGYDAFGLAVAVSADGSTVAISDPHTTAPTVFIYDLAGAVWTRTASFVAGGTSRYGNFGAALALSGDGNTAIVGAPNRDAGAGTLIDAGGAYRYVRNGTTWAWGGDLYSAHPVARQNVGLAVAVSFDGSLAAVGAPYYGVDLADAYRHLGVVYLFSR